MKMKLLKKDFSSPHNYVFALLYLMPREHFIQMLKKKCQCESSKKKSDLVIKAERHGVNYELKQMISF